jgi:hypothetical protein
MTGVSFSSFQRKLESRGCGLGILFLNRPEAEESLLYACRHKRFFVAVLLRMTRTVKFRLKPKMRN